MTVTGRIERYPATIECLPPHGYVSLIEVAGSDEGIVEAARMSTGKGFQGWKGDACPGHSGMPMDDCAVCGGTGVRLQGDEKLLAYLWRSRHTTPFEQAWISFEIAAPLFVFREWHRHRTQSYNELSARYTQMPDAHYVPTFERIASGVAKAGANKQAQGTKPLATHEAVEEWLRGAAFLQKFVYEHYEEGLQLGIPKEVARLNTPVARFSKMRAAANLLNWLRFLGLRDAPDAQWEIQVYARAVKDLLTPHFPRTLALCAERPL